MKYYFFFAILVSSPLFAQISSQKICPNKTVYVTANKASFKAIKNRFMIISSLPYDVQLVGQKGKTATIAITHFIEGQKPNAWEIQSHVRAILKDKIKDFKITKFSVNFRPEDKCK